MKVKLQNLWESLRTSFWFLPAVLTFLAIALSFLLVFIDKRISPGADWVFGFIYGGGPEGARLILSTIAGSMITVAGVVFSITIVALTLASSQFGPRLLRNFMHDTGNQVVLGTFISTFVYCLLVLRSVETDEKAFVPNISVAVAIVLALASIAVLIYFIHHVSVSMQADQIILAVYGDLEERMRQLFPDKQENGDERGKDDEALRKAAEESYTKSADIHAAHSGYLQSVDYDHLVDIAKDNDLLILVPVRPGDYIVEGITLIAVKGKGELDDSLARQLANTIIVGSQRTPAQDAEFAIHQLVEVAIRALSPGVNDPYTAISCVDRLGSALCLLCGRKFPSPCLRDKQESLRVICKPMTFESIINAAFDQIRQYGRTSVALTIRLLETLEKVAVLSRTQDQREAILRQANMILRSSRSSLEEQNDIDDVRHRYQVLLDLLAEKEQISPHRT